MLRKITGVLEDGAVPGATIDQLVPFRQDMIVPRGEDGTIEVSVFGQDGAPVDVSAWAMELTVRAYRSDEAATLTLVGVPGGDIDHDEVMVFTLASDDTADLSQLHDYWYDVQRVDVGDRTQLVAPGKLRVGVAVDSP